MSGLESLLRPRSVAVIGATEDIRTYAGAPLHNLRGHGFTGAVYAVNPNRQEVQGVRCFPSVLDIPGEVDTAVIAVPSRAVVAVLSQCVEKGLRSATIVASGFGEDAAGPEGQAREAELSEVIRRSGIRVLGPNTTGLANLADGYVPRAAFNQFDPDHVRSGATALISQSGACGNVVFNRGQANGLGIGLSVATGDQVDIDLWEMCEAVLADGRFQTLMVIAETMGDPVRFERVARRVAADGKLLALLKLGRSDQGRRAVMTHSGSLAGDSAVQSAAMRQLGVIEVLDLDDLWQLARLVDAWGPPPERPGRLGVISLSGGEGALTADRCSEQGIELAPPSASFAETIAANFSYASASNPFDPSGEVLSRPDKLRLAVRAFLEQNEFTEVLFSSPVLRDEQAERQLAEVPAFLAQPRPNLCFSFWSAGNLTRAQERILTATGQPVFAGSGSAVRAIALYRRAGARRRVLPPAAPPATTGVLPSDARYWDVRTAAASIGLRVPPAHLVRRAEDLGQAATAVGFPLVMKANVTSSVHKLANGLLAIGVASQEEAASCFASLTRAGERFDADGVVVEAIARGGLEVLIGATRDPDFGGTLLFGSGGSAVEYLRDTAIGVARYVDPEEARTLVGRTRIGAFLEDQAPDAAGQLAAALRGVATWFEANRQLSSLDLNPLIVDVGSGTVTCVDARVA
jgi:acetate---CoA ligase (ADP-forming)